jgi:hypothetical protein
MKDHDISVLYLDHLSHVLRSGSNTDHYGTMTEALQRINRWAESHHISVIGGWHQSKGEGPVQDKLIGSVGIRTSARCVLVMAMDPDTGLRFVAVDKSNDLDRDTTPAKSFTIVEVAVEHEGNTYAAKIASGLDDVVDEGAGWQLVDRLANLAAMVSRPKSESGDYLDADGWLQSFFDEKGPKILRKLVLAWAEPEGFSERTIERAFARLGGTSTRVGREAQWELTNTLPSPGGDDLSTEVDGRQSPSTSVNSPQPSSTSSNKSSSRRDGRVYVARDVATADVINLSEIHRRLKEKK